MYHEKIMITNHNLVKNTTAEKFPLRKILQNVLQYVHILQYFLQYLKVFAILFAILENFAIHIAIL